MQEQVNNEWTHRKRSIKMVKINKPKIDKLKHENMKQYQTNRESKYLPKTRFWANFGPIWP